MKPKQQRTALITGASRGLGLALARGLARRGWNLVLTARDEQRLRAVRDELAVVTHVAAVGGDVTAPNHRHALSILARGHAGLDAVINNAGALGPSPQPELLDYPLEVLTKVLAANVVAPLGVLQAVRDELKPGARIINRPLPEVRVPAFINLLEGDLPSGRYVAASLGPIAMAGAGEAA